MFALASMQARVTANVGWVDFVVPVILVIEASDHLS